ncbi:ABC transporter permease subunit [Lentilactobacillus diolivorans]|uniref:ABC transporter permease n=2 Tax=Lentilactobacillus diolivorans TaxID=179838 RepID=A0ABQ0XB45_9LACO|nr:ABC transporter permease subunit [Lentilactobacillus diolivorans]KRL66535.1 putative membrane spanning protein [Lentilactobacillus diolivorans DSM 14421]GEP23311.1 ABC transporter permease [Lentilactobacillus diolivorans]
MGHLYRQEIFKLFKRTSTFICIIALIFQNVGFAITSKLYSKFFIPKELFVSNYATTYLITLVMIGVTATNVASEFGYHTINNIIYQGYSRQFILISKWLAVLTYSFLLYTIASVVTLLNKFLFFRTTYSLTDQLKDGSQQLWQYWVSTLFANFVTLWLLLSVVFLLAAALKSGVTAVIVGITGYFALSIIGRIMFQTIQKWEPLKWNPINFMNYPTQLAAPDSLSQLTRLTNTQLLIGNLLYILIFLLLGLYLFSKKEI